MGAKQPARNSDNIADVQCRKSPISLGAETIAPRIDLEPRCGVLKMEERGFAEFPDAHDPAGDTNLNRRSFQLVIADVGDVCADLRRVLLRPEIVRVTDFAAFLYLLELLAANFDLIRRFFGFDLSSHTSVIFRARAPP